MNRKYVVQRSLLYLLYIKMFDIFCPMLKFLTQLRITKIGFAKVGLVLGAIFYLLFFVGAGIAFPPEGVDEETSYPCGPYALSVVAKTFGIEVDVSAVAYLAKTTPQGNTSMKGLADAAHQLGFHAKGMKLSLKQLVQLKPPIIAHVNQNHYIVIETIFKDKLQIIDNAKPSGFMSLDQFDKIWAGHILIISPRKADQSGPNIEVDPLEYDFGVVDNDKPVRYTFYVKNTGTSLLKIREIVPDCNCTLVSISSKIIAPGEQTQLTLEFDIGGDWGSKTTTATILSNDPHHPATRVVMRGIAKTTLPISPSAIELGHKVDNTKTVHKKIRIRDNGLGELKIEDVKTSSKAIVATIFQTEKGEDAVIDVSINPQTFRNRIDEFLLIYTSVPNNREIRIPISGEIATPIQIFPKTFFFGIIKKGKLYSRTITITFPDTKFHVTNSEGSLQEATIKVISADDGRQYAIEVNLSVKNTSSKIIRGKIKLYTNHPEQPLIEIPLYAVMG